MALGLGHERRLAREHGLVDGAAPRGDHPVHLMKANKHKINHIKMNFVTDQI